MKILSLDTSSKNAIVVITQNEEKIIELNNEEEKTHSQKLMPLVDSLLKESNINLQDINLLSCSIGPRFIYRSSNWYFNSESFF